MNCLRDGLSEGRIVWPTDCLTDGLYFLAVGGVQRGQAVRENILGGGVGGGGGAVVYHIGPHTIKMLYRVY